MLNSVTKIKKAHFTCEVAFGIIMALGFIAIIATMLIEYAQGIQTGSVAFPVGMGVLFSGILVSVAGFIIAVIAEKKHGLKDLPNLGDYLAGNRS